MFFNGNKWNSFMTTIDMDLFDGYSIYEVIRTYDSKIFAFDKHFKRLKSSGSFFSIKVPPKEKIIDILYDGINLYKEKNIKIKIYITPQSAQDNNFYSVITPMKNTQNTKNLSLIIAKEKISCNYIIPYSVKTHLLGFRFFLREKYKAYYDALLCDENGYITECTKSSFCCIKENTLFFPKLTPLVLPGVTRDIVIELARTEGISIKYNDIHIDELEDFSEFMLTNTTNCIVEIKSLILEDKIIFSKDNTICSQVSKRWYSYIQSIKEYWD